MATKVVDPPIATVAVPLYGVWGVVVVVTAAVVGVEVAAVVVVAPATVVVVADATVVVVALVVVVAAMVVVVLLVEVVVCGVRPVSVSPPSVTVVCLEKSVPPTGSLASAVHGMLAGAERS